MDQLAQDLGPPLGAGKFHESTINVIMLLQVSEILQRYIYVHTVVWCSGDDIMRDAVVYLDGIEHWWQHRGVGGDE